MAQDQQRLTPTERANLVAYLDRELPEGEARVIASKLTHSATARREAETLEKTWELLDHLSHPGPSRDLSERTLTEIRKIDLEGGRLETAFVKGGRTLVSSLVWVVAACIAFGIGWGSTRWIWPNSTERLTKDLSIAEHLDEYRGAGDFSFLKLLADTKEFGSEPEDDPRGERPQ